MHCILYSSDDFLAQALSHIFSFLPTATSSSRFSPIACLFVTTSDKDVSGGDEDVTIKIRRK